MHLFQPNLRHSICLKFDRVLAVDGIRAQLLSDFKASHGEPRIQIRASDEMQDVFNRTKNNWKSKCTFVRMGSSKRIGTVDGAFSRNSSSKPIVSIKSIVDQGAKGPGHHAIGRHLLATGRTFLKILCLCIQQLGR